VVEGELAAPGIDDTLPGTDIDGLTHRRLRHLLHPFFLYLAVISDHVEERLDPRLQPGVGYVAVELEDQEGFRSHHVLEVFEKEGIGAAGKVRDVTAEELGMFLDERGPLRISRPVDQYILSLTFSSSAGRKSTGTTGIPREANLCGIPMLASDAKAL